MSPARRAGVVTFAGVLFLIGAFFNAVFGVVAIADADHFTIEERELVVDNFKAFGVVLLVLAFIQLLVGWGIIARIRAAQVIGIILAIVSAITVFAHFTAYPAWSVIILILNAVIIYALTVYNPEFVAARR